MGKVSSYYRLLNINEDASLEDVKRAYKKQAFKYHPDLNEDRENSQAMFILLKNAYEALTDKVKRNEFQNYVQSSNAIRDTRIVKKTPAKKGERRFLDNDLDIILWDIEGYINDTTTSREIVRVLLEVLTFLDKWVLCVLGFPCAPARDKKWEEQDPREYMELLTNRIPGIRISYVDYKDYFFDVHKRTTTGLLSRLDGDYWLESGFFMEKIAGIKDHILDGIIETQNMAFYYLGAIHPAKNGESDPIKKYVYKNNWDTRIVKNLPAITWWSGH